MQPLIAAMIKVRQAFYAALVRSLLRTKSLLKTILDIWFSPTVVKENGSVVEVIAGVDATQNGHATLRSQVGLQDFLKDVEKELRGRVGTGNLLALSSGMRAQTEKSLKDNPICMLPSFNHQLPTGDESGTYLALDVGGSTFRVALIQLLGGGESKILRINSFKISQSVKGLKGVLFFDWMAERILETLSGKEEGQVKIAPLSMGLAWSFPIEQTSIRSGLLQGMGKFFLAADGLLGQDLGDLIQDACSRQGLNVQLDAIVNDSTATLLSKAYLDPSTRFALILGTGVNLAVHLPVHVLSTTKFGNRPAEWFEVAKHVIVNTEMSMFGGGLLPLARWDKELNLHHAMPEFQPLEHFVAGGYLGEIARLVLVEGIRTAGIFGGVVPENLTKRYSLETETISRMESDQSSTLVSATEIFASRHPTSSPPTFEDIHALRTIASSVSYRAAAVLAAAIHAQWTLRNDSESISVADSTHTVVAYNGSVMENYPNFQEMTQKRLDELVKASGGNDRGVLELEHAEESSLLGAAIAVACIGR